ncbi:putative amidase [Saccharomycopsis crataegensis]|uniref:amidase n=1 Tax=Saccharomycopsis crataegensis TaxID=43959 RepID=A0AAV5QEZ0_9ASCO|nr:putative amidase [Saccharomycopsis crataegensis]
MTWQETAKNKRDSVMAAIPQEWILDTIPSATEVPNAILFIDSKLTEKERAITYSTILELQPQIQSGKLSALEVTKAFAHRSALLHQLTNCCAEIFFDKAFETATYQDEFFAQHGRTIGPLHGIPLSAKDQINLEGIDSAMGFVSLINNPIEKQDVSKLAIILQQMGAIFFIKTTTPPAMMAYTTTSNIYGETVNVYNRKVSCGGSSGGEGALIGGRGAPLGWGTDIGGSIRVPSSFAGIYGLRGSTNRLPYCKLTNSFADQPVLSSVVGPMASDLQDLKYVMELVIQAEPWKFDPKCPPIPWRDPEQQVPAGKLVFALQSWNKLVMPSPPVKRALAIVKEKLIDAGHDVIEWDPPISSMTATQVAVDVYGADGYKEVVDYTQASGEPIVPEILSLAGGATLPKGVGHIHEHWDHAKRRYEVQQAVDDYWFNETTKLTGTGRPVDGIICPVWDTPSFKTRDIGKFYGDYVAQFNTLDYSVVVVPVLCADKLEDTKPSRSEFVSDKDEELWEYYDAELVDGCPVGVQVVAPRWQEETAIGLAEVVDGCLRKSGS